MKNLKKLTAVLLTVAMITAMALVPAFAEGTSTISADATTCQTLKVLQGENGVTADYLAKPTLRYQLAIILLRLLDKEDDALAGTYTANFADAKDVNADNQKILGFLKAHPELGWEGDTATGKFDPLGKVTPQMFDKVLLYTLGYAEGAGKDFEYANAVSFAGTKGLSKLAAKTELTNDDLATGLVEALKANIKGGSKTFAASLIEDTKTSLFTAAQAETAGLYSVAPTATAAATGAKKLTVTFSKAVDTTKAAITVKKGTVTVNTDSVVFAADSKSAVITTTTNLTKGDYTVTVSGLTATALTATVTAADEKVAKITILSKDAPRVSGTDSQALVRYQVLNQYGEAMIANQGITWTVSTGVAVAPGDDSNAGKTGVLTIKNTAGAAFVPGATVYLTAVHAASGTVLNDSVTIALASKADSLVFKGVYDRTNSKLATLPAGFADGRWALLYEVLDQYGTKIANPTFADVVFTSNNPLFVGSTFAQGADVVIDGVTYEAVELDPGSMVRQGGSATIQAISITTGKVSAFTTSADALAAVKTFTMSAPASIVAEGETVEIPYTAVDQYGNPVTSYDALNGAVTFTPAYVAGPPASGVHFVKRDDGTAKLVYVDGTTTATPTTDIPVYLTSLVANGGSFSSVMLSIKDAAAPKAIVGLDAAKSTFVAGGNNVQIQGSDLVIQDQYGRTMTDTAVDTWLDAAAGNGILVTSTVDGATPFVSELNGAGGDTASYLITDNDDYAKLSAQAAVVAATETVTFKLTTDGATAIAGSDKAFTFTKVNKSSYSSFEVKDFGKMYNDAVAGTATDTDYNKTVVVYGVMADGTKVTLPASDYNVTPSGTKLAVAGNVISDVGAAGYAAADFLDAQGNAKDITVNTIITVNATDGSALAIIEKPLVVSNATRAIASVTFTDDVTDGKATIASGAINAAAILGFIDEVRDQYGVLNADGIAVTPTITISGLTKVTGSTFTVTNNGGTNAAITGATLGDKFTATIKYGSYSVTIAFTVGA